jgi:signal recognition particle subunit SRP9
MVYVAEWGEFSDKAAQLFLKSPVKVRRAAPSRRRPAAAPPRPVPNPAAARPQTRYTFKYRHSDSSVVLKVTDDVVCLKYKTDQASDMKLIEKFNNLLFRLMASNDLEKEALVQEPEPEEPAPQQGRRGGKNRRKQRD